MPRRCSPPRASFPKPMNSLRLRLPRGRRRPGTAQRPNRFRAMLSNRLLWPGMIGVALAVGIGVQMGESAIGSINPIHFQGAAPPVAAIDPNAPPPAAPPSYADAYGWQQGYAARQAEQARYEDFDYLPPSVERVSQPALPPLPRAPVSLAPWPPGRVSSHPEVERFTDFPIETKPTAAAPAATAAPAAAPQPLPDAPAADPAAK
jgi:hypothetical protein